MSKPARFILILHLCISMSAFAGIDSGGGISMLGEHVNHSSIGCPFATFSTQAGSKINQSGIMAVFYFQDAAAMDPYDPMADSDHDGSSNFMEFLAGTDPGNPASVFRPQGRYEGGLFRMPIPTIADRNYHVWASKDLSNWTLCRTFVGDGGVKLFEFDETAITSGPLYSDRHPSSYFFRTHIVASESDPSMDTDQDGSTDQMEYLAGTDPNSAASVFRPLGTFDNGVFCIPIPTLSGRNYQIWASRDLRGWTLLSTLVGDDRTQNFDFDARTITSGPLYSPSHPSSYFFKIQILIP